MTNGLKVSFYLKKNETDAEGKAPVMGRIRIGKTEAPFSAKTKVHVSLWDTNFGRVSGKSREATELNQKLDTINVIIHARYGELLKSGEHITAGEVKAAFQGIASRQSTLMAYFRNYVDNYEKRTGKDREKSTFKELQNALNHVARFLKKKYRMTDIPFSALKSSFIEDYDFHLRIELKLRSGTILGLISRLRRMIKYAINEGIISSDPFYSYKPVYPKANQKYLTLAELESIIHTPFHVYNLIITRDLFLFSCFTGLAYTDICHLTEENIKKAADGILWIRTTRRKTGVPSNIPLLEIPLQIIEKYRGTAKNGKLFPMPGNSFVNRHLKTIATACGIRRNLIFHMGRHTYASTITLSQGVPVESVSSMLGHKNLNTTNIYAKITGDKIGKDLAGLEIRLGNKYELTQLEALS
jgi:site-specific recombinase XerD